MYVFIFILQSEQEYTLIWDLLLRVLIHDTWAKDSIMTHQQRYASDSRMHRFKGVEKVGTSMMS